MDRFLLLLWRLLPFLLATGCANPGSPLPATPQPSTVPVPATALIVPTDRILIRFETIDCYCHVGDTDYELLRLPGVARLDWEVESDRVWLVFLDDRRPSDEEIRACIETTRLKIKEIRRP